MGDEVQQVYIKYDDEPDYPFNHDPQLYCPSCGVQGQLWEDGVIGEEMTSYCLSCGGEVVAVDLGYHKPTNQFPADAKRCREHVARLRRAIKAAEKAEV